MYPTYDPEAEGLGLRSSATNEIVPMEYRGIITFVNQDIDTHRPTGPLDTTVVPAYTEAPVLNYITTSETNFLDARPMDSTHAPAPTHSLYYEIVFSEDDAGVNRPHVNGHSYVPPSDTAPMLFNYLNTNNLRVSPLANTNVKTSALVDPALTPIYGSGAQPFVVPHMAVVDVLVNNTDGGEHPMHLHGHSFWIVASSDYPDAETLYDGYYLKRDIASVPAQGWVKLRFVADNPGVWPFHCHIDWHMALGLFTNIIEAPEQLRAATQHTFGAIPSSQIAACPTPVARRLEEQAAASKNVFASLKDYVSSWM